MSELPPEIAVEPEPTDADPLPEAIRPARSRIWPEEPRAPRPQIKRSMEEWLAEFDERVKQVDARPREQPSRRRRPRGLARIVPVSARPERPRETAGAETGRPSTPDQQRRGRRRGRGGGGSERSSQGGQPQQIQGQARPQRATPRGPRGNAPHRPSPAKGEGEVRRGNPPRRPSPPRPEGDLPGRPPRGEGDVQKRRRRRGRGRGRGPRPDGSPPGGGPPSAGPPPS